MELLPRITSAVELARTKEEIGKTFMIMQAFQKGADYIEQAKEHWRSSRLDFQVGGLHDILIWEAQFASSKGDHRTAELRLEEMSKVVSTYDLSQSKCSSIIHDAYGVCLALLANSNSSDPSLPIPFEYREYHPAFSGWVRPAELVQIFDQTKLLPIGIEIVDSKELSDKKESLRLANESISEFNSAVSRVLDRLDTNDSVEDNEGTGQSVLDNPKTADSQH
ncbi:hypothetical protein [Allorhodopirellula heiligendammensis]|nr:hypothetical protein [Allorhodopirellula heiligendammensis]